MQPPPPPPQQLPVALPVGFRFSPTDEELVRHYLKLKIEGAAHDDLLLIPDVDLSGCEPWELLAKARVRSDDPEWSFFLTRSDNPECFFFAPLDSKYPGGHHSTAAGYWKATGMDSLIRSRRASTPIGFKKTLVFHQGKAPQGHRTAWIMHEYHRTAEPQFQPGQNGSFVLYRLFNEIEEESEASDAADSKSTSSHLLATVSSNEPTSNQSFLERMSSSKAEVTNITIQLLKIITDDFSQEKKIGSGRYGEVYKGVLNGDEVAVKKMFSLPGLLDEAFVNEFNNLMKVKHKNIMQLFGYCYEIAHKHIEHHGKLVFAQVIDRALCFEYMQGGSLLKHISDKSCIHDWPTTYKIIKGTCEGVHYLHKGRGKNNYIYHLDLKPDNILLDKNMVPKIGDFGLSKLFGDSRTYERSITKGTIGFMPPEFIHNRIITPKNDVFSLGVIIFHIMAGEKGYNDYCELRSRQQFLENHRQEFLASVQEYWKKKMQETAGYTWDETDLLGVKRCTEIAMTCVATDLKERPTTEMIIDDFDELDAQIEKISRKFPKSLIAQISSSSGLLHGSGLLAPQDMPLELLREITNSFADQRILGTGTFGTVYKGVLDGKEVAVKLLHHHSMAQKLNYEVEFMKEFENVRRLNHPNIVQLLGYCYETKLVGVEYKGKYVLAEKIDRALCFEYMHNGNLQQYLDDESCGLDWQTRYKIIKGICEGLKYLHKGLKNPMLHLDLKPGNILLDKNMVPKLADFGLSKLVYDNQTQATSNFFGTIRYCPPEHFKLGYLLSNKFDIFSLGVVMIEIIAGSKGYEKTSEMPSEDFTDHVQENWIKRIHQATAGCTSPKCECRQVKRCIEIALQCVHPERIQRPGTEDIISRLNETENKNEKSAPISSSQNET